MQVETSGRDQQPSGVAQPGWAFQTCSGKQLPRWSINNTRLTPRHGKFDQCRHWEWPSVHYSVNGFNTRTPGLTKVRLAVVGDDREIVDQRRVAAICLSKAFSGCGTLRRPHSCAISVSISNIKLGTSLSSASNHSSNRSAWRRSPRMAEQLNASP